jgi:ferredoxin
MSRRKIITIDTEKCTGCGLCIPNCPEGALQIIDGKARLVSDLFCDGLGACLGHCPEGAITVEERDAAPYDERKVMESIAKQGDTTIAAHLEHLEAHGEKTLLEQAISYLKDAGLEVPEEFEPVSGTVEVHEGHHHGTMGCPGSRAMELAPHAQAKADSGPSALSNWPIQLHLIQPTSPLFQGKDVLLAADCTAYASAGFHGAWLSGKTLAIACPKLDEGTEIYKEKITAMIDHAKINTLTVMMMEVPCCRGLLAIAEEARQAAHRKIPLKAVVLGIKGGEVLSEEWVSRT